MQTAAVVCTVALVVLSPPPRVCLPRAQIFLAAGSEHDAARGAGRGAASLQKIIDGEATLEEAQLELARQRHTAGLQTMVDRGDAATLEGKERCLRSTFASPPALSQESAGLMWPVFIALKLPFT